MGRPHWFRRFGIARANAPGLVAAASLAAVFAGLWLWAGVGAALTVVGGVVFVAVSATHLRGGYG